ncbi:MAG: haloalkane dehalogenase [Actinomycetota bacterium]
MIAPDLIGMGDSGKPDMPYRFGDQVRYFDAFIEALGLEDVTFVLHDWGGGVGFDHAMRNQENMRGLVFFEAAVRPQTWSELPQPVRSLFKLLRSSKGDRLMLDENYFIEKLLPVMVGRKLSEAEHDAYRAPFKDKAARKPVRVFPQQFPIDGLPAGNHARMTSTYQAITTTNVPLLLLTATPGAGTSAETFISEIPNLQATDVGEGLHYVQETQPTAIGEAVSAFIDALPSRSA